MGDIKEQAFTTFAKRPSLLVMAVGTIQLLGGLYAGVVYPETAMWILIFNSAIGTVFLGVGMGLAFYGTKKKEEANERRIDISPRIKITDKQRLYCKRFPDWVDWVAAINSTDIPPTELALRINLGMTQGLTERREHHGVIQIRSISDQTIIGGIQ